MPQRAECAALLFEHLPIANVTCHLGYVSWFVPRVKQLLEAWESLEIPTSIGRPRSVRTARHIAVFWDDGQNVPPIFIAAGKQLHANAYHKLLHVHVVSWFTTIYLGRRLRAPAGWCALSQPIPPKPFLQKGVTNYWAPDIWPLCSPNLNPLDYVLRGVLKTRAQATSHANVESLKSTITHEWHACAFININPEDEHALPLLPSLPTAPANIDNKTFRPFQG